MIIIALLVKASRPNKYRLIKYCDYNKPAFLVSFRRPLISFPIRNVDLRQAPWPDHEKVPASCFAPAFVKLTPRDDHGIVDNNDLAVFDSEQGCLVICPIA